MISQAYSKVGNFSSDMELENIALVGHIGIASKAMSTGMGNAGMQSWTVTTIL